MNGLLSRFWKPGACIGAALTMMLIGACAVGPNYKSPEVATPERFTNTALASPTTQPVTPQLDEWWKTFNDELLDDMIERAMYANLDLHDAEARVREARAARGIAFAALLPNIDMTASYDHLRRSGNETPPVAGSGDKGIRWGSFTFTPPYPTFTTPPTLNPPTFTYAPARGGSAGEGPPLEQNLYQIGFDATWEIDVFGGNQRAVEAAEADIQFAEEDRNAVAISIRAEVARNYVEARSAQQRLRIARDNIVTQQTSLDLARSRFEVGLAGELDVAQAQSQLSLTQSRIPAIEADLTQSIVALAVLLGDYPDAVYAAFAATGPIPVVAPEVPIGIPSDLLRRRPDVRRAERALAAQTARIGVAVADLYPRFSLTGNFGMQAYRIENLWDWRSRAFSIGPGMRWPIFEGGRIRAQIAIEESRQLQAFARWEKSVLSAVAEVESAIVAFRKEQEQYVFLAAAVAADRRAVELSSELYSQGLASFLNVIEAQRSLYISEDQLVATEQRVVVNLIILYKALGGGIEH